MWQRERNRKKENTKEEWNDLTDYGKFKEAE